MRGKLLFLLLIFSCTIVSAQVMVNPISDLLMCDDNVNDGITEFDLTVTESEIIGGQDPTNLVVTYHLTLTDADSGINSIANPTIYVNSSNPQTIYVRLEDISNGDYDTGSFDIEVIFNPDDLGPFQLELCDDDGSGSSNDQISIFDLTTQDGVLTGGDPGLAVIWFETLADEASDNPIVDPAMYLNNSNPQTVFGRVVNQFGCKVVSTLTLVVHPNPAPAVPDPFVICDDNDDGFAEFNLVDKDNEIINGEPNVDVLYFESESDAQIGNPGLALASPYTNVSPLAQTVYARVTRNIPLQPACYRIVPLDLYVLIGCPDIAEQPDDIFINEGDGDGQAVFDLTANEAQMLGGQNASDFLFTYYVTFIDSYNDTNPIGNTEAYTNSQNPETIYVRMTEISTGNFNLADFEIETDGVLGVQDEFALSFQVFPNPVSDMLTIVSGFDTSEVNVSIFDVNGRLIMTENLLLASERIVLNVSELSEGLYFVRIISNGVSSVKKILKK